MGPTNRSGSPPCAGPGQCSRSSSRPASPAIAPSPAPGSGMPRPCSRGRHPGTRPGSVPLVGQRQARRRPRPQLPMCPSRPLRVCAHLRKRVRDTRRCEKNDPLAPHSQAEVTRYCAMPMVKLQRRPFGEPDDAREIPYGRLETYDMGEIRIAARFFSPAGAGASRSSRSREPSCASPTTSAYVSPAAHGSGCVRVRSY